MARATMAALIAQVRLLINDPVTSSLFLDDQVQDALDRTRVDVRYLDLTAAATIHPGGSVTWQTYYAQSGTSPLGDWEADAVLVDRTFTPVATDSADYIVGRWTFAADQRPPVYLVGRTFDRFGAAAELLEDWASTLKLQSFDIRTADQAVSHSQLQQAVLGMATRYRQRMRARMIQSVRTDAPHTLWQQRNFDISRTTF